MVRQTQCVGYRGYNVTYIAYEHRKSLHYVRVSEYICTWGVSTWQTIFYNKQIGRFNFLVRNSSSVTDVPPKSKVCKCTKRIGYNVPFRCRFKVIKENDKEKGRQCRETYYTKEWKSKNLLRLQRIAICKFTGSRYHYFAVSLKNRGNKTNTLLPVRYTFYECWEEKASDTF